MKRSTLAGLLLTLLVLGGCVFAPGGNDSNWNREHGKVQPTIGQQLIDLNRAHESGVLTDAEFERTKRDILDSVK